jgi:hypothetical protein
MAITTIVINGSTTGPLLGALGLLAQRPEQAAALVELLAEVEDAGEAHMRELPRDNVLGEPVRAEAGRARLCQTAAAAAAAAAVPCCCRAALARALPAAATSPPP